MPNLDTNIFPIINLSEFETTYRKIAISGLSQDDQEFFSDCAASCPNDQTADVLWKGATLLRQTEVGRFLDRPISVYGRNLKNGYTAVFLGSKLSPGGCLRSAASQRWLVALEM